MPAARPATQRAYGDVLFRAWRGLGGGGAAESAGAPPPEPEAAAAEEELVAACAAQLETLLEQLADAALHATCGRTAAALRAVLGAGFHGNKTKRGVDALLLRLWQPLLFREGAAAARLNEPMTLSEAVSLF